MDDEPRISHTRCDASDRSHVLIRFQSTRHRALRPGLHRTPPPTLEQWVEDAVAVLDAGHLEEHRCPGHRPRRAPSVGLMAATHSDRVSALVPVNGLARVLVADDDPMGIDADLVEAMLNYNEPLHTKRPSRSVALVHAECRERARWSGVGGTQPAGEAPAPRPRGRCCGSHTQKPMCDPCCRRFGFRYSWRVCEDAPEAERYALCRRPHQWFNLERWRGPTTTGGYPMPRDPCSTRSRSSSRACGQPTSTTAPRLGFAPGGSGGSTRAQHGPCAISVRA